MLKKIILLFCILFCSLSLFAEKDINLETMNYTPVKHWTVFRMCFAPGGLAVLDRTVYGLNIGIPASYTNKECKTINGLDVSIASTAATNGMQLATINTAKDSTGFMLAFVNMQDKLNGFQLGLVNECAFSNTLQIGVFNEAQYQSKTFQIGLLNYIDDAPIPFLPFINFKF